MGKARDATPGASLRCLAILNVYPAHIIFTLGILQPVVAARESSIVVVEALLVSM